MPVSIRSSHSGYYIDDCEQQSMFDGIPFRSLVPEDIVDRVSILYNFPRDGATPCVSVIGTGTFHFDESIIIIKRTMEGGGNMVIESPSVEKFNEVISAIRSGEITQQGKERTVLELVSAELHHAKFCLKETKALLSEAQRAIQTQESQLQHLKSLKEVNALLMDLERKLKAEIQHIKSKRWYKMDRFFSRIKKYFRPSLSAF